MVELSIIEMGNNKIYLPSYYYEKYMKNAADSDVNKKPEKKIITIKNLNISESRDFVLCADNPLSE